MKRPCNATKSVARPRFDSGGVQDLGACMRCLKVVQIRSEERIVIRDHRCRDRRVKTDVVRLLQSAHRVADHDDRDRRATEGVFLPLEDCDLLEASDPREAQLFPHNTVAGVWDGISVANMATGDVPTIPVLVISVDEHKFSPLIAGNQHFYCWERQEAMESHPGFVRDETALDSADFIDQFHKELCTFWCHCLPPSRVARTHRIARVIYNINRWTVNIHKKFHGQRRK